MLTGLKKVTSPAATFVVAPAAPIVVKPVAEAKLDKVSKAASMVDSVVASSASTFCNVKVPDESDNIAVPFIS